MSTPLRAQYLRVKQPFPNTLLFFRLGDFYELYDEDAETGARELDLMVTSRAFSRNERVPMCAVPYHAIDGPVRRLVSRGYKVAICEQIGDPRTSKGLVEREVVRVVSPSAVPSDRRRPTPDYPCDTMLAEQPPGAVVLPPHMSDAPVPSADTSQGSPPDGRDWHRSASGTGARMGGAIQLPLFGAPAGPAATGQTQVQPDNRGTVQLGLF